MPEVVEDAGFLVEPFSVDDITKAMATITSDNQLRNELIRKSKAQAKKFSWQKTYIWNLLRASNFIFSAWCSNI